MLKGKLLVVVIAICCVTLLEAIALIKGVDGQLFATVVAAISGMIGFLFGNLSGRGDAK